MVAICALFLPQGPALKATSISDMASYTPYPKPVSKPYQCYSNYQEKTDAQNISAKQAAAAALGLYFGVKHANAPQIKKEDLNGLCI